ncbi:hypothetical protein F0562_007847 [Nyssa sinensis]|uniref:EamA domain-containing protein n=1 Tax=Nyssa sinensis TaxID=561372 RepID=A0A5J5A586_9ASTE|nr:hypothetical protein F0562_007847 [Nyssa sinensis]
MRIHGENIADGAIVENILRSMAPKFDFIVCSIEEANDIDKMSIDELQSSLLVYEQKLNRGLSTEQALKASTFVESSSSRHTEAMSEGIDRMEEVDMDHIDSNALLSEVRNSLTEAARDRLQHYWKFEMMKRCCDEWYPVLTMIAIDFSFAIMNILLKKVVVEGMNHLVFITYRQCVSTIFLAPIGYFVERKSRPKLTLRILCHLFLSALVGTSLTQYFFLLGIQYTSATYACAFLNMVPMLTFIMALPFGLETVNVRRSSGRAKVIGTLVCFGGAMLLTLYKGMPLFNYSHSHQAATYTMDEAISLSSGKRKERWTIGCIALIAGTLLWSSWFLIQSSIGKRYPCQYSSTAFMSFFGVVQSSVLSLSIDRNLSMWVLKGKIEILTILYAGMVGSGLCFVGMSWCVKKRGPVFTAAFSPLVQIMAAVFDIPILHEQLHLGSLLGSITVIVGLYILLWGKSKEMQNCVTKVAQETEEIKDSESQLQVIPVANRDSSHS